MVQTNLEEIQKLGEQLRIMVAEARPILKDLKTGLHEWREIEKEIQRAVNRTKDQVARAAETYSLTKEVETIIEHKIQVSLENLQMINSELTKLQELHGKIQQDVIDTVGEYTNYMRFKDGRLP
jgi:DNA repair exonuclease SbcCD ATPase subunit